MSGKKVKRLLCVALALATCMSVFLSGCKKDGSATNVDNSKRVTLKYYFRAPQVPSDLQTVNDAMNKILEKKIHADIQLVCIVNTDYLTKLNTMISAQENFDLCFTSTSAGYADQVTKGAYVDMTKLLPKYAPKTYALFKPDVWNAAKVNGKIYASINQQAFTRQSGFVFNKDLVSKYNFDYSKVKTYSDLTPLLAAVKAGEPANRTTSLSQGMGQTFNTNLWYAWNWENTGSNLQLPGMVKSTDKNPKVFNQYATSDFKQLVMTMADWYQKGYIPQNILTQTNFDNSQMPAATPGTIKPGGEIDSATQFSWKTAIQQPIGDPYIPNGSVTGTMTSVSATSKNPERAVQYIELINNDKELYNLLCHGIQGTHYNFVSGSTNRIQPVDNTKYKPNMDWEFGNTFNDYLQGSQPDDIWAQTKKLNDTATVSGIYGFVFDDSSVKTQEANCLALFKQYAPALGTGVYSAQTEAKLSEFISALKNAGSEAIMAEEQKQLDAFLKAKK